MIIYRDIIKCDAVTLVSVANFVYLNICKVCLNGWIRQTDPSAPESLSAMGTLKRV